jgi:hypothetical protein
MELEFMKKGKYKSQEKTKILTQLFLLCNHKLHTFSQILSLF